MSGKPVTDSAEVIAPSKTLGEKAVKDAGPGLEAILARSEKSVAGMHEDYCAVMKSEFKHLQELLVGLTTENGPSPNIALKEIYTRCHDIRGLAATFGYPLVTAVGSSLCKLIDRLGERSLDHIDVITIHIETMAAIVNAKATDDGGKVGQQLTHDISHLVSKIMEKPS